MVPNIFLQNNLKYFNFSIVSDRKALYRFFFSMMHMILFIYLVWFLKPSFFFKIEETSSMVILMFMEFRQS